MKNRMKKIASLFLVASMTLSLAACGSSEKEETSGEDTAQEESAEEGEVLNIWCWNDEFQSRFNDYYPEVKEVAEDKSTTTLNDGTVVPSGKGVGNIKKLLEKYNGEILTLEPHLYEFSGLKALEQEGDTSGILRTYKNNREAFDAGVNALKEIITL